MRYLLALFFSSISFFVYAQSENINPNILAEYYSTKVSTKNSFTNGKSLPYFFVLKYGPTGGAVAIDGSTAEMAYGEKYPIAAKITLFKRTQEFPDNLSLRIDFGYLKNDTIFFPWSLSSTGIRHQKLVKIDADNKMYFENSSQKNYNVLFTNNNLQSRNLTFFQNHDASETYLNSLFTFENIEQTIDKGSRIGLKRKEVEIF